MLNPFSTRSASSLSYTTTTPAEPAQSYIATPYVASAMSEYVAIGSSHKTYISGGGADDEAAAEIAPAFSVDRLPHADIAAHGTSSGGGADDQAAAEIAPAFGVDRLPRADIAAHGDPTNYVYGTGGSDRIIGTEGKDAIWGDRGSDVLFGMGGDDTVIGNEGDDVLIGGTGNDVMHGGDGNDLFDFGLFAPHDPELSRGSDTMMGAKGDDWYFVDNAGDKVIEEAGEGHDAVITNLGEYTLPSNVEDLFHQSTASDANFMGTGNEVGNAISSGAGNDVLDGAAGDDTLKGGAGADTLIGGKGDDALFGGTGSDVFRFREGEAGYDIIKDFNASEGDRIDLSTLGVERFADLKIITGPNGGSVIAFGDSSIQLDGVAATSLTEDRFIFSGNAGQEAELLVPAELDLTLVPTDAAFADFMAIAEGSSAAEVAQASNSFALSQQWASPLVGADLSGFATAAWETAVVAVDIPLGPIVEMPANFDNFVQPAKAFDPVVW